MASAPSVLWEIHLRVPPGGPVSLWCKRGGERLTNGVVRTTPIDALSLLGVLLADFAHGDQLFVTARAGDSKMSMWTTCSRAAGLYWCAAALTQLWQLAGHPPAHEQDAKSRVPVRHSA